jgi:hypothetical protein
VNEVWIIFGTKLTFDELVESHFPLIWWEGIKGRGKITGWRCKLFHPHPNPPPSRGREFWTF